MKKLNINLKGTFFALAALGFIMGACGSGNDEIAPYPQYGNYGNMSGSCGASPTGNGTLYKQVQADVEGFGTMVLNIYLVNGSTTQVVVAGEVSGLATQSLWPYGNCPVSLTTCVQSTGIGTLYSSGRLVANLSGNNVAIELGNGPAPANVSGPNRLGGTSRWLVAGCSHDTNPMNGSPMFGYDEVVFR